ncbi:MAG: acyloxyacyl hydrolase, partial [Porphyromonadaceae bacterium]|nr:acyloxyacyl hydrolase [Porphyromonadaceae bacterium]
MIVSTLLLMFISIDILASDRDTTSNKIIHMTGIDLKPGYVFPSHEFFKGENNAQRKINSTLTGHLKYGFKFAPDSYFGSVYPYAIQGIGIGYNTFFNSSE